MGLVNVVVPHAEPEETAYACGQGSLVKSPASIKMLKSTFNLTDDGMVKQQVFAGEATCLAYMTDQAKEGRDAFFKSASRTSKTLSGGRNRSPRYFAAELRRQVPCWS